MARPRIHIGLADTGCVTARAGGGIGFAVDGPATVVDFAPAEKDARFKSAGKLDADAQRDLQALCRRLADAGAGDFLAKLVTAPSQHVGFGSKTSLALAVAVGINALFELRLTREQLQMISGRGGLSGIGVHTFFLGGVVVDGGHLRTERIVPSSFSAPTVPPPCLAQFEFPQDWRVALLLDPEDLGLSGAEEARFFAENLPTPRGETYAGIGLLYHGVLPALRTASLGELSLALREFHQVGFKAREVRARSTRTIDVLRHFHRAMPGVAAGMSSTGPLIYTIIEGDDRNVQRAVKDVATQYGLTFLGVRAGWNKGYEVVWPDITMESAS